MTTVKWIRKIFHLPSTSIPIICGVLGAIVFLIIYGNVPLITTFDLWIRDSFVEHDVIGHYAGWLFFRNSPWSFPLGLSTNMGYPAGGIISFTDSIPIIAILFKILSPILPETFQYFGIYVLICFVLQGVYSAKLIKLFTEKKLVIILGTILFCYSPVMIERAFRHTALASHFLIISSLYSYFRSRKSEKPHMPWAFLLLNVLSIGIHPYFLPIVFGLTTITCIEYAIKHKHTLVSACFLALNIIAVLAFGYLIGLFGTGVAGGGGGFGFYSMNLNATYNPSAIGPWEWSRIFRVRPQTLGNYDGFNYLGAGVILFILYLTACFFMVRLDGATTKEVENSNSEKERNFTTSSASFVNIFLNYGTIKRFFCENIFLILLCIGMTLFAISNVVTYNGRVLFQYPVPEFILSFCAIFRASSRMFYLTYYVIFLCVLLAMMKFNYKKSIFLLSLLVVIQVIDIYPAIQGRHAHFAHYSEMVNSDKEADDFSNILKHFDYFIFVDHGMSYRLALQLADNHMKTNGLIANRAIEGRHGLVQQFRADWSSGLNSGNPNPKYVYSFANRDTLALNYLGNKESLIAVEINDLFLLIPQIENLNIPNEYLSSPTFSMDFFLSDGNWDRGYSRYFVGFFVPNVRVYRELYRVGAYVEVAKNDIRQIVHAEERGAYLHIHLDGEPFNFADLDFPLNLPIMDNTD